MIAKETYSQFLQPGWRQAIYFDGNFFNSPPPHPQPTTYVGDTVANGITYSIICQLTGGVSTGFYCNFFTYYVRKQGGQVFWKSAFNNPELLLYDFSLNINDTISIHQNFCHAGNFIVDTTYNITLFDGSTRKYLKLLPNTILQPNDTLEWIEDIGDINLGFFPECDFEGGHTNFICHKENGQTLWANFQNTNLANCDSLTMYSITGTSQIQDNFEIKVYPNPIQNELNINTNISEDLEFVLIDISGKPISNHKFKYNLILSATKIIPGIYIYKITNNIGFEKWGKIVK